MDFRLTDFDMFILSLFARACPMCGGDEVSIVYDDRTKMFSVRCKKCGHEWDVE